MRIALIILSEMTAKVCQTGAVILCLGIMLTMRITKTIKRNAHSASTEIRSLMVSISKTSSKDFHKRMSGVIAS